MLKENMRIVNEIREMINESETRKLKEVINEIEDYNLADLIEILEPKYQVVVFRLLEKDKAIEVFEHIEPEVQQDLLQNFTDEKAVEFFKGLEPDDRAKLMDELPAKVAKRLLASLSNEEREYTNLVMGYDTGTAGNIMTPKYIRFKENLTVEEGLKRLREVGSGYENLYQIYVTDNSRRLIGTIELTSLVTADPKQKVSEVMVTDPISVTYDVHDEVVSKMLQESDLLSIPVIDKENRLLGAVTVDDAIDVLEEEAREQALSNAGFADVGKLEIDRSRVLTTGSLPWVWRIRMPYLMLAMAGGLMAGFFIERFEDTLAQFYALAFFIPVIMDMGGNVGTQSSTIFTRAVVLGQIDFKRFLKQWGREIAIGFTMGVMTGILAGAIVYLWQGFFAGFEYPIQLALVIAGALVVTITVASAVGFIVPFLLVKLGFDQAAGSVPFITTIKDITGILIYFLLANMILPVI